MYRQRFAGIAWRALAVAGLGCGVTGAATAQQVLPNAAELNPAQQARTQQRPAGDLLSAAMQHECALPDDPKFAFTLTGIDLGDQGKLLGADAASAYADYIGTSITPATLCIIRDRLNRQIYKQGVLGMVVIPEQTIGDGRVRLTTIVYRLIEVRYHGNIGPAQHLAEAYLNNLINLSPFRLDAVQRFLILANEIPGVRVTASLSLPQGGNVADGGVNLEVNLSRSAIDGVASVQNTGSNTLGPWSAVARVDLNSMTALGERTSVVGYSTLGNNSQQIIQLIEQVRLGTRGLYAQGSFAYGRSRPRGALAPLRLDGRSYVGSLELHYPLLRRRRAAITVGGGADWIDQSTEFGGGGLLVDDHLRILFGQVAASWEGRARRGDLPGWNVSLSLETRKGLAGLGSSKFRQVALSRPEGRADAWVMRAQGDAGARVRLGEAVSFNLGAKLQAQWADRPLLSYEEQAIGNLTIGRGYDPSAVSGDRAIAVGLRAGFEISGGGRFPFRLSPYGFFDLAHIANLDRASQAITVRSAGGGAELRLPGNVRLDLVYASPLDKTFPFALAKPPGRFLFQIVVAR